MSLLFLAADTREFAGLLHHVSEVSKIVLPVHFACNAKFRGEAAVLAANGAGTRRAALAVDSVRASKPLRTIVNLGFCGALDPELGVADIVAATEVRHAGATYLAQMPSTKCESGPLISIDHVAQTASEKRDLFASGSRIVDMEAGGAAERAAYYKIPFYSIRSVSDLAGETLACDFNAALRENGKFSTARLIASALQRPLTSFPELMRLRQRTIAASNSLGDFLASCRF